LFDSRHKDGLQIILPESDKASNPMKIQDFKPLSLMAPRLVELRRTLKSTGSIYLHCDPTASHYLKMLMDAVFGPKYFRNEIVWKRTSAHNDSGMLGNSHDIILLYTKTSEIRWNKDYQSYDDDYLKRFRNADPDGRKWNDS